MAIVLTYDLDSFQSEIKKHLIDTYKYQKTLSGVQQNTTTAVECDLGDTTLYHPTRTVEQGHADIKAAAASYGAKLEKSATFPVDPNRTWLARISRFVK